MTRECSVVHTLLTKNDHCCEEHSIKIRFSGVSMMEADSIRMVIQGLLESNGIELRGTSK